MQKEKEKSSREYESLKRDLNGLLRDFEKNKQWADFSNWLHRLFEELSKRKFPELPQQVTLCKRLAQCLNPALPAGVHTTVLKVYEVILKNFGGKTELLPLMAVGLFPFFEHSNYANKLGLLKLFQEQFADESESVQMIVGLSNALLTGLNENSEEFARKIYAFFDRFGRNYGRLWVDGAVWINILKSPKVRLAGFKYFMKVFRDRDRILLAQEQPEEAAERAVLQGLQARIEQCELKEEERVMLASLHGYRSRPDENSTRFPNFSTLIVNTLCVCLEDSDQMIKRSSLDLLINYLKLSTGVFQQGEGQLIVGRMLQLLPSKEYNLTNRVYKYLFDQPNAEGNFTIDFAKKAQELTVLQQALSNLLSRPNPKGEGVLLILELLLADHPVLTQFLLTRLSFQIISFVREFSLLSLRRENGIARSVQDFYLAVIVKNKRIFLESIIGLIAEGQEGLSKGKQSCSIELLLQALQFYFSRLERIGIPQKGQQSGQGEDEYGLVRKMVVRELISYSYRSKGIGEKLISSILDLSNQLLSELMKSGMEGEALSEREVVQIEEMLAKEARLERKVVYAKLITLLPQPRKQQLLPYIEDSSLSIVCINILLGGEREGERARRQGLGLRSKQSLKLNLCQPIPLNKEQQCIVFNAIFKLLNCHLFESRALQFIQRFREQYCETFGELINIVDPSEWLIYWKKMEGSVAGGIVRMIENLESPNSYHKHLSKKWMMESEGIVSKVIDPVYEVMRVRGRKLSVGEEEEKLGETKGWNIEAHERVFLLMRLVFRNTSPSFSKFFFLQRDKYLNTFIIYVFKCIETDHFPSKSRSLQMLTFLLDQARDPPERYDILNLTLPNILSILDSIIAAKRLHSALSPSHLIQLNNLEIQLLEYVSRLMGSISLLLRSDFGHPEDIIRILKSSSIYEVILKGMEHTQTSYIKTLYMDSGKEIAQMVAQLDRSKVEVTAFISRILEQLFSMLKSTEMNTIEDIIRSRNGNSGMKQSLVRRRKGSVESEEGQGVVGSFYKESVKEEEVRVNLNLEEKYGEIIELWNAVKFYIQFAIRSELKEMPVINLISLILQSFPFSYLKYTTAGSATHVASLQGLEEEISNVTGLKKEVLEIFEILWNKESRQILDFLIEKGDPRILVHAGLDPSKVLETFNRNGKLKDVTRYMRSGKFNLPRNTLHYNLDTLLKENQLLYFLYVYLLYFSLRSFKHKRLPLFLESLVELLKTLRTSSHIQTKLWLLEIIELVGQRVLGTRQVVEGRTRGELQEVAKDVLDEVVSVVNKSRLFTHRAEVKTGLFTLFSKEEKESSLYDFVKIFPPSIFESYEKYLENVKRISRCKEESSRISSKLELGANLELPRERLFAHMLQEDNKVFERESRIDQYLFVQFLNRTEDQYANYLAICALKTLIRIANPLLLALYDPKDLPKTHLIVKEILVNILPICENKDPSNQNFNELIAEYLHRVLSCEQLHGEIIRMMRKSILDVFMANDFFKCTQKTLFYWKGVIDLCAEGNNDLLGELLSSEGLFEGIFTKKAEATRQKIKSFERVCFVIYSGKIDKYENKLRTVLESLNEVMKQEAPSPALLVLILFCIRILLMRLSTLSLNKLFRSVWPSLITLLIQIFRRGPSKNLNLQLAALKVIELIHALELEEFMLHKWMFIFDYFGLKIDPLGDIEDNMTSTQILTPFAFKPFLTNALPYNRLRCKFMPEKADSLNEKFMTRRRLIVKKTNVESQEELREYCALLMQYMMDLNEYRSQISKDDIENVIQDDFISLDDYIFKIK